MCCVGVGGVVLWVYLELFFGFLFFYLFSGGDGGLWGFVCCL